MAKATLFTPPVPESTVTLEITPKQAQQIGALIGALNGGKAQHDLLPVYDALAGLGLHKLVLHDSSRGEGRLAVIDLYKTISFVPYTSR